MKTPAAAGPGGRGKTGENPITHCFCREGGIFVPAGERRVELWVAAADGEPLEPGGAAALTRAVGLVLGNEGAGVSAVLEAAARRRVAIRLSPGAESLNVAIAAAILLREVARVE